MMLHAMPRAPMSVVLLFLTSALPCQILRVNLQCARIALRRDSKTSQAVGAIMPRRNTRNLPISPCRVLFDAGARVILPASLFRWSRNLCKSRLLSRPVAVPGLNGEPGSSLPAILIRT